MFIVKNGTALCNSRIIIRNGFFGEEMIQRVLRRRGHSSRSLLFTDCYLFDRADLFAVLVDFPSVAYQVTKHANWLGFKRSLLAVAPTMAKLVRENPGANPYALLAQVSREVVPDEVSDTNTFEVSVVSALRDLHEKVDALGGKA